MYSATTQIRVRYGETDQMGVVYHGNYALYFEIARTEALRKLGVTYRSLEDSGIMMPVVSLSMNYKKSAKYDDLLSLQATFPVLPTAKTVIDYIATNEVGEVLCTGQSVLAFIDKSTNRIVRCPNLLLEKFAPYFKNEK
ncbi:MAG: acyl-CoA thioesterase [Bacteroidia bacterium]|nr:acyl-CoA thioesterase [Bacteroidia bacterium]MCC7534354.1 acyl-CoA thioesterase [Bacteroidia bacterium]